MSFFKAYRLASIDVRNSTSAQDAILLNRPVTLNAGVGTVSVPFAPGSQLQYLVVQTATVVTDANGQPVLTVNTGTDATTGLYIFGNAGNTMFS